MSKDKSVVNDKINWSKIWSKKYPILEEYKHIEDIVIKNIKIVKNY